MKLTLAQINPTIGDFSGNLALIQKAAHQAQADGSQMVVFPELTLTGYYPADLLDDNAFRKALAEATLALKDGTRATPGLYWVVGLPIPNEGEGKPFHNALLVFRDGEEVLQYAKQLLPTYNVFDERRHFEPGPDRAAVLKVDSARIGFLICEDGWNDDESQYAVNPFLRLAQAAPDLVVSINASPSNLGKRAIRHRVIGGAAARHGFPVVYVNQVGGHDQLVYDGASFIVGKSGKVTFEAKSFSEQVLTLDIDAESGTLRSEVPSSEQGGGMPPMAFYQAQIVMGLQDYARRCGFKKAVVGSSGGIDSALTLALAAQAFGPENVIGITMPSEYSSQGSVSDSEILCRNLGVQLLTHPIADLVNGYAKQFEKSTGEELKGLARENLQARIRGTILMEYSNAFGNLLLTTGNKSELSVGYCTLYGDTNGGLGLIGDLYKTEVFELCRHINAVAGRELIPTAIIEKAPSAELAPDQKDTDSLPPYEVLDPLLQYLIEGEFLEREDFRRAEESYVSLMSRQEGLEMVARIRMLVNRSEYKRRQAPPVLRVRPRAFGAGRQLPIAAVYPS